MTRKTRDVEVSEDYIRGTIPADIARLLMMIMGLVVLARSEYRGLTAFSAALTAYTVAFTVAQKLDLFGLRKKAWFWYSATFSDCAFNAVFTFLLGNVNSITATIFLMYASVNALNTRLKKGRLIVALSTLSYVTIGILVYLGLLPKVNILGAGRELSIQSLVVYSFLFFVCLLTLESIVRKISTRNEELIRENREQKDKLATILVNILPLKVIEELESKGSVTPIRRESASILFTDMIGFTNATLRMEPEALIDRLDELFTQFDAIARELGIEKIKTIGDGYMCVAGLIANEADSASAACAAAIRMLSAVGEINGKYPDPWGIRIGINTGSVIAGIIGRSKYNYDVWGDAVNVASRMESSCPPDSINVSRSTFEMARRAYRFQERGLIEVKGGRKIEMFELIGAADGAVGP